MEIIYIIISIISAIIGIFGAIAIGYIVYTTLYGYIKEKNDKAWEEFEEEFDKMDRAYTKRQEEINKMQIKIDRKRIEMI